MATNVFNINEIFSGELVLGDLDVNEADSNDQQEEGNQQELGQPAEEQKLDDTANLDEDVLQVILNYLLLRFLRSLNWLLNFLLRSSGVTEISSVLRKKGRGKKVLSKNLEHVKH